MRKKLGLIFGGPSSENEISIISARSIFENLDVSKFEIFPIFMNHERDFFLIEKKKEALGSFSDFFLKIKSSKEYDLSGFSLKKVFFQKKGFFEDETKLFFELDEELPYHAAVLVRQYEEKNTLTKIVADIVVSRETQKAIIIGKNGSMIKKIGQIAREDIEKFIDRKVFLELHVKVRKDWRNNDLYLKEYGY